MGPLGAQSLGSPGLMVKCELLHCDYHMKSTLKAQTALSIEGQMLLCRSIALGVFDLIFDDFVKARYVIT